LINQFIKKLREKAMNGESAYTSSQVEKIWLKSYPKGIPAEVDQMLRASGCKVDRLAGPSETDTRRMLRELAAQNKRFMNLK